MKRAVRDCLAVGWELSVKVRDSLKQPVRPARGAGPLGGARMLPAHARQTSGPGVSAVVEPDLRN